jgi:UDP-N-acetylmuramoyl-tripeptide--D-alanyl-D-alanine ligase
VIPLRLAEVEAIFADRVEAAPWADEITGVEIDSRRISEGDLFVAIGAGSDFVKHAFARGAAASAVPEDAFAAMARLGSAVRQRSNARVIGITGSTGKTSTKDILAALCVPSARTVAAEASYNNEIGVPLTLCRLEPDTEVCILELAMRGFGQIAHLCEIARPEIGVITNIGPVHLELVESVEGVIRAKSELVAALPPGGTVIVPDEFVVARDDVNVVRLREPDVTQAGERTTVDGVSFNFTARHQAANAHAALATLDALGLPRPDTVDVDFSRWRGDELELPGGGLLINDAYNANPISMRAALEHLLARADGRPTVAVLGDMAELGPDAAAYHREIGALARELAIDRVIGVGELAANYEGEAHVATAADAVPVVADLVQPGDCVLVKGSRAIGLELVADALAAVRT